MTNTAQRSKYLLTYKFKLQAPAESQTEISSLILLIIVWLRPSSIHYVPVAIPIHSGVSHNDTSSQQFSPDRARESVSQNR